MHRAPGAKNWPRLQTCLGEVFDQRLGGGEMDADGAVLVAFLVDGEGGLFAVLMKILDPQAAGGGQPDTCIQVGFENGAVAEVEHLVTGGQAHQLAGAGGGEGAGAFEGIGGFAGDELGVGRVGDIDGQAQFGGGAGQILVEARERGDAAVEGFRGLGLGHHLSRASRERRRPRRGATGTHARAR